MFRQISLVLVFFVLSTAVLFPEYSRADLGKNLDHLIGQHPIKTNSEDGFLWPFGSPVEISWKGLEGTWTGFFNDRVVSFEFLVLKQGDAQVLRVRELSLDGKLVAHGFGQEFDSQIETIVRVVDNSSAYWLTLRMAPASPNSENIILIGTIETFGESGQVIHSELKKSENLVIKE